MSDAPRYKRPKLEREHARRAPAGFSRSSAGSESDGTPEDARSGNEAISRGVELGYRVIDEYVRQGTRIAQAFSSGGAGPGAVGSDVRVLSERMFQYASEAATIWLELFGMAAGRAAPDNAPAATMTPSPVAAPAARDRSTARATPQALAIALESARPVEVALRLHDPGATGALRVHDLRAGPGDPRLEGVRIEADADGRPWRLHIHVPETLPAGNYNGLIIDEATNRPAGTLSVTVGIGSTR